MAKSPMIFPFYDVDADGYLVRRYDHQDDAVGVIVAFCPNPMEAGKFVNAMMRHIEHGALIGVLNDTHNALQQIQKRLDDA